MALVSTVCQSACNRAPEPREEATEHDWIGLCPERPMSPAVELRGPQAVQNYDARFWEITPKSGSHVTHRWREPDSNLYGAFPVK